MVGLLVAITGLLTVATPALSQKPAAEQPSADKRDEDAQRLIDEIKQGEELALSGRGGYNYDPAGRPDPFVSPIEAPGGPGDETPRPEGWPGMLINEVKLRGITVFGGEPIAVFLGTDGNGYFAREGDELWDGKIEVIDFDEGVVVFKQKVEDPTSPIRHRRVERKLNP